MNHAPAAPTSSTLARGRREFLAYLATSIVSLAVDVGTLWGLTRLGFAPWLAAGIAYVVGLAVHFSLSVTLVFRTRVYRDQPALELTLYLATGLVGTVLSSAIVAAGEWLGVGWHLSKGVAVGVCFVVVYLMRRQLMFSRRGAGDHG